MNTAKVSSIALASLASALILTACGSNTSPDISNPLATPEALAGADTPRNRYEFNNQCFVLRSNSNNQYVTPAGNGYTVTSAEIADAEAFYLKPSALGSYLLYNRSEQLLTAGGTVGNTGLQQATDSNVFEMRAVGDATTYPIVPGSIPKPANAVTGAGLLEPTLQQVNDYLNFVDPEIDSLAFTLTNNLANQNLAIDGSNQLVMATIANDINQSFKLEPVTGCTDFPEAQDNTTGDTFSGTVNVNGDDIVLGMVDGHVHISSSDFLGQAQWGSAYHKFGVTHAMGLDCEDYHGPEGSTDVVGGGFGGNAPQHNTTGWPTFPEWPARDSLFHEAIYWKWLERAWKSGLRVAVNDLVDNETLCELQRNVAGDPSIDCNSMNNAGNQATYMYGMQDYIDAQYGGRGDGFFQIVLTPEDARDVIEDGKLAIIIGIEISNLMNCRVNYANPAIRQEDAFEESGSGGNENSYTCSMTETGAANEIATQLQRMDDWGVRQVITIHEFDNAFGGNGIFGGLILNLGSFENSNPTLANPSDPSTQPTAGGPPAFGTGEVWTTFACPQPGDPDTTYPAGSQPPFSGYIWGGSGGDDLESLGPCNYQGDGEGVTEVRPGGPTPCYPAATRECNARWLTPIGIYFYKKLMETGMIFDIDHLAFAMKTQALELAEAQDPPYPFVSTHGTFGGISVDHARRMLKNGGSIYPSIGSTQGYLDDMTEIEAIFNSINPNDINTAGSVNNPLFGFGFGTDTNGLSAQTNRRGDQARTDRPIAYPFTLFQGGKFDQMPEFNGISGVTFEQPSNATPDGTVHKTWHIDEDGNAHFGMMAGQVEEMVQEATVPQLRNYFYAAEVYLRVWERTIASQQSIINNNPDTDGDGEGNAIEPAGVLRPAPSLPFGSNRPEPGSL